MASSTVPIDNWSDSEIRTKLAELGTPVGPVTETTRKILVKKLKRLLQLQSNNAGSPVKQRRSLVRYSSGEDSQGEDTNMPPPTTKMRNLRRKTTGATELLSALADSSVNADVSTQISSERTTRGSRKSLGTAPALKISDSFDTDSDSDVSLSYMSSRLRKSRRGDTTVSTRLSKPVRDLPEDTRYEPPIVNSLKISSERTNERVSEQKKSGQEEYEEQEEQDTEEEEEQEEEERDRRPLFQSDFMSRLSSGGALSSRYRSSVSPKPETKPFSSYVPSFTSYGASKPENRSYTTRHQINSFATRSKEYVDSDSYSNLLKRRQTSTLSNVKPKPPSVLARYKSIKLLAICGGIFILLLAAYFLLFTRFNTTVYLAAIDSDENKYPICGQDGVNSQVCIEEADFKNAMDVSKVFIPRVIELAVKAYCDPSSEVDPAGPQPISEDDALKYLATKMPSSSRAKLEKDLRNFKVLVLSNPHWEVKVDTKGLTDIKAILFNGEFVARRFDLPIGCHLRLLTYTFIKVIIVTAVLVCSVFGTLFLVRLYKRSQEKRKKDVYNMVSQILNLLSAHHDQNIVPAYLSVDNCRDELIMPIERERKRGIWEDAVDYVEKHESRVRTEVHSVRGENVKVWRWLPSGGPPVSPSTSMDSTSAPILGRLL